MKKGLLILLWTVAIVFAGHDDWRRPPRETPSAPVPEPATLLPVAGAVGMLLWMKQRRGPSR
jgi:hypothetical protein